MSISNQRRHAGRDGDGAKSKDQRLDDQKGLTSISFLNKHSIYSFCFYLCMHILRQTSAGCENKLPIVIRSTGDIGSCGCFKGSSSWVFLFGLFFILFWPFSTAISDITLCVLFCFGFFFQFFSALFGISCRPIWHWFSASWHFSLALLAFFFSLLHTFQRTPFVLPVHSLSETLFRSLKARSHHITQGQWIIVQVPQTTCSMLCPGDAVCLCGLQRSQHSLLNAVLFLGHSAS